MSWTDAFVVFSKVKLAKRREERPGLANQFKLDSLTGHTGFSDPPEIEI